MSDIETRTDIDLVMRVFYEHALVDDVIGFIFTDVVGMDLEDHLPVIGDFWEGVLFASGTYASRGRDPMEIHRQLDRRVTLTDRHFNRWLELFCHSIDNEFQGPRAEFLKARARAIAARMREILADQRCPLVASSRRRQPPLAATPAASFR